jgi:hypothetical protein
MANYHSLKCQNIWFILTPNFLWILSDLGESVCCSASNRAWDGARLWFKSEKKPNKVVGGSSKERAKPGTLGGPRPPGTNATWREQLVSFPWSTENLGKGWHLSVALQQESWLILQTEQEEGHLGQDGCKYTVGYPSLDFYCRDKIAWPKAAWEGKGLFQPTVLHHSLPSLREARAGT